MSAFLYLALLAAVITIGTVLLSREARRDEPTPDPFTFTPTQQADFDVHTAQMLAMVRGPVAPVVRIPTQRDGGAS